MSEQPGNVEPEGIEIDRLNPDAAFGALMEALAPEDEAAKAAEKARLAGGDQPAEPGAGGTAAGGDGAAPPAAGDGVDTRAGQPGEGAAAPDAGQPGDGAAGAGTDGAGGTDGERPATWTASVDDVAPKFGELSTAFEENVAKGFHEEALGEIREEYTKYFEQLEKHPRLLVGTEVPRIDGKEGMEKLSSTEDAREWQEAVKSILVQEVKGRAEKALDDSTDFLATIHSSIELFQNNADLVPYTKEFDVELANRFAAFSKDYEKRTDEGKLHGYTIPVQPIIDQIRAALVKERATKTEPAKVEPAAAGSSGAAAEPASTPAPPAGAPQAGIQSKAGESDKGEDFTTLWGTLGLPNIPM